MSEQWSGRHEFAVPMADTTIEQVDSVMQTMTLRDGFRLWEQADRSGWTVGECVGMQLLLNNAALDMLIDDLADES